MNTIFTNDIQSIIYRYIHYDALITGFAVIFPIHEFTSPFYIASDHHRSLKSDLCQMCYHRNTVNGLSLHNWLRCCDILDGLRRFFTIINGCIYQIHIKDYGGIIVYVNAPIPDSAKIDVTKCCLYKQCFNLYEYCIYHSNISDLDNYNPTY